MFPLMPGTGSYSLTEIFRGPYGQALQEHLSFLAFWQGKRTGPEFSKPEHGAPQVQHRVAMLCQLASGHLSRLLIESSVVLHTS